MRERGYLDFDLLIDRSGSGGYRARVVASPTGETGPVAIELPFTEQDLEIFLLKIGRPRLVTRAGPRNSLMPIIEDFGGKLFDAVFRDQIRVAFATSLDKAEGDDVGLRIRLRLADAPELADLPWEFIYDRGARRFLALSDWTPLVRYLEMPSRIRPLSVTPPLRILMMAPSPADFDVLDSAGEKARLREALSELMRSNRVIVEEEPSGTLAGLQRQLRRGEYHVFHFIGHGGFDEAEEDGVLYFEGHDGHSQAVSGQALGELLHDHRSLRLAVLNACEGARSGREDPFGGTAQSLVQQGIPAVVAMQFEISDRAAITFSHSLYDAVADGYPLDASMAEARKSVRNMPNPVEWATPVLHMRTVDGRVFAVATTADERQPRRVHPESDHTADDGNTFALADTRDAREPVGGQSEPPHSSPETPEADSAAKSEAEQDRGEVPASGGATTIVGAAGLDATWLDATRPKPESPAPTGQSPSASPTPPPEAEPKQAVTEPATAEEVPATEPIEAAESPSDAQPKRTVGPSPEGSPTPGPDSALGTGRESDEVAGKSESGPELGRTDAAGEFWKRRQWVLWVALGGVAVCGAIVATSLLLLRPTTIEVTEVRLPDHFRCEAGDHLEFTATGGGSYSGQSFGPEGLTNGTLPEMRSGRASDIPTFALLGALLRDEGKGEVGGFEPYFEIGTQANYTCPVDGSVTFDVNHQGSHPTGLEYHFVVTVNESRSE